MRKRSKTLALCLILLLTLSLLAACGQATGDTQSGEDARTTDKQSGGYEVLVTDEEEKPVPGVKIQFCSDTECIMGTTDDTGVATFDKGAGTYTVHVLTAPDGYLVDTTEYSAPNSPGLLTIVLKK